MTILGTKLITNDIFNCLRQVAKWGFETNILHGNLNEIYISKITFFTNFYLVPFVSMDVICNVKSHIEIWWMEIMKILCHLWNEFKMWIEKVHTKSFSYMFLWKLWELVKHGINDNSFEYAKKVHLNMLEMKKINEWDKACILWRDFFN